MGEKPGDESLGKIAKYFLAAGVLTIITFVCWLIPSILPYATPYLSGHTIYVPFFGNELEIVFLLQNASIALPSIMGLIQTGLLYKAWKQIRVYFSNKDQQRSYRSGGVEGAGRVLWAMDLSAFGYALIVIDFILQAIAYSMNITSTTGPILTGFGEMLSLAGLINQGIGMSQSARGFQLLTRPVTPVQAYPYPPQQYQNPLPPSQYGVPQAAFALAPTPAPVVPQLRDPTPQVPEPPRPRFCTGCGAELPASPGLKFCPTCGSKV